jgi:hypothetical protein
MQFSRTASREENQGGLGPGIWLHFERSRGVGVAIDNGMSNEADRKVRRIPGVPFGFKGKDGKQEVVGAFHASGTTGS